MMYPELPAPIALGMCGALAGLIGGGCNQCFPVWVGASTGAGLGCVICIVSLFREEPRPGPITSVAATSVAATPVVPVVIQNIYITYEISGQAKGTELPVAKVIPNE
jgi:hypothetical protein